MVYYIIKISITTVLIVIISEVSKKSSFIGALLASIPLISVLTMFWLYIETKDVAKVSSLSTSVFWLVLPSLVLFLTLPWLINRAVPFYLSIGIAIGLTIGSYWLMIIVLNHFGVKL